MIRYVAHPIALAVGGLAFLSAAAWTVAAGFGLAATGVSLLLLEWRLEK